MLLEISQFFDPLDFVISCIIIQKILLEKLKLNVDIGVRNDKGDEWWIFKEHLVILNNLEITRVVCVEKPSLEEVHGFSNASLKCNYSSKTGIMRGPSVSKTIKGSGGFRQTKSAFSVPFLRLKSVNQSI